VGINNATGQMGTVTTGATPYAVLGSTNIKSLTTGMPNGGGVGTSVDFDWTATDIKANTMGLTVSNNLGGYNAIVFPTVGTYEVFVSWNLIYATMSVRDAVNTELQYWDGTAWAVYDVIRDLTFDSDNVGRVMCRSSFVVDVTAANHAIALTFKRPIVTGSYTGASTVVPAGCKYSAFMSIKKL
jgi:hypothetical protein